MSSRKYVTSEVLTIAAGALLASPIFNTLFMRDCDNSSYGKPPNHFTEAHLAELKSVVSGAFNRALYKESDDSVLSDYSTVSILDALCRWNYRNSEGIARTVYYAISLVTSPIIYEARKAGASEVKSLHRTIDLANIRADILSDDPVFLSQIFQEALITQALAAKLPLTRSADTYTQLSILSTPDKQTMADGQLIDESMRLLGRTSSTSNVPIRLDGPDARESAIRRLFQTVSAIAEYKTDKSHSELRGFLNTASTVANLVRFMSADHNEAVSDVLSTLLPVEKLIQNYSYTANTLLQRAYAGQLVYAEMINLCTQWYSLINADLMLVFKVFAHLLIHVEQELPLTGDEVTRDIYRVTTDSMFKRADIARVYATRHMQNL